MPGRYLNGQTAAQAAEFSRCVGRMIRFWGFRNKRPEDLKLWCSRERLGKRNGSTVQRSLHLINEYDFSDQWEALYRTYHYSLKRTNLITSITQRINIQTDTHLKWSYKEKNHKGPWFNLLYKTALYHTTYMDTLETIVFKVRSATCCNEAPLWTCVNECT